MQYLVKEFVSFQDSNGLDRIEPRYRLADDSGNDADGHLLWYWIRMAHVKKTDVAFYSVSAPRISVSKTDHMAQYLIQDSRSSETVLSTVFRCEAERFVKMNERGCKVTIQEIKCILDLS